MCQGIVDINAHGHLCSVISSNSFCFCLSQLLGRLAPALVLMFVGEVSTLNMKETFFCSAV